MAKQKVENRQYEEVYGRIDRNGATFFLPTPEQDREAIAGRWLSEWRKGIVHRADLTGQTEIMVWWPSGSNRPRDYRIPLSDVTFTVFSDGSLMLAVSGNPTTASVLRCLGNDPPSELDHHTITIQP